MTFVNKMSTTGDIFHFPKVSVVCVMRWLRFAVHYTIKIHNYSHGTTARNIIKTHLAHTINRPLTAAGGRSCGFGLSIGKRIPVGK